MRRNMSGNFDLYKYIWPGSVYVLYSISVSLACLGGFLTEYSFQKWLSRVDRNKYNLTYFKVNYSPNVSIS